MDIKDIIEKAIAYSGKTDAEIARKSGYTHRCGLCNTIRHMGDYSTVRVIGRLLKACKCAMYVKIGDEYIKVDYTNGCRKRMKTKRERADVLLERLKHDRE